MTGLRIPPPPPPRVCVARAYVYRLGVLPPTPWTNNPAPNAISLAIEDFSFEEEKLLRPLIGDLG